MYGLTKSLGLRISQLRQEKGWTQKELAQKVGISQNHVSRIEKDKMQPRHSTLKAVAEALGIDVEDLENLARVAEPNVSESLAKEDPDLAALVSQIPLLSQAQKDALKITIRSMVGYQKVREFTAAS